MATSIHLNPKEVAWLWRAAFPNYRGRKVRLEPGNRVSFFNTHWDGGSRNYYVAVRLEDGYAVPLEIGSAPWLDPSHGQTVEIPEGFAVVENSIFCGKDMGLRIYIHPSNRKRLLTDPLHKSLT